MSVVEATIEAAILALHARDADRASQRNGVGFNGRDTAFGNSLAFQIRAGRHLSPRQMAAAYRMLRTYRGQLANYGIEYDAIPKPDAEPAPAAGNRPDGTAATGLGTATIADGRIVVTFDGMPAPGLLDIVKAVPGRRYVPGAKAWILPGGADTLGHVAGWPERIARSDVLTAEVAAFLGSQAASNDASRAVDATLTDLPLAATMYPFQRAGVAYAAEHPSTLIADEMGLGKTIQALATIEYVDAYPALVVVPAVVKLNWRREVERWIGHRSVYVAEGRTPRETDADIVIVNYDILGYWQDTLAHRGFKVVVADEAHYAKNAKAKRTKALKALARQAGRRILLTGTPILNRPAELIAPLEILGLLDRFGGWKGFTTRYCDAHSTPWGLDITGAANLGELHEKLRSTCMVRRTKDQVLTDLPAKRRAVVPVAMTDADHYVRVRRDLKVWLAERLMADREFLAAIEAAGTDAEREAAMLAARKAAAMRRAEAMVKIEALKQTAATEKLEAVIAWIEDFLTSGRKLVVFGHHKAIIGRLADHFGDKAVTLTGETAPAQRQAAVDRFQTDPATTLFLGNLQAAGVGITLTAASDVAIIELPWRPGDLSQAEDRCHRIGQTDSVTAWYLLAAGTIEESIAQMLDTKKGVVDHATDGKDGIDPDEALLDALLAELEGE